MGIGRDHRIAATSAHTGTKQRLSHDNGVLGCLNEPAVERI